MEDEFGLQELTIATLFSELGTAFEEMQPRGDEHTLPCGLQDHYAEIRDNAGMYKQAILKEFERRNIIVTIKTE